ncbi:MAG: hypothetical protein O3C57_06125, partial [Verrucomicrobia bacterium]|nr:hypothetical protein [Verrucomicrobiota bacterium]
MSLLLTQLPRQIKMLILMSHDALAAVAALWLTVMFRVGGMPTIGFRNMVVVSALVALMVPAVALSLGYYRLMLRYYSPTLIARSALIVLISGGVLIILGWAGGSGLLKALGLGVVFALVLFSLLTIDRLLARWLTSGARNGEDAGIRAAIYGAGAAGRQLVGMMRHMPEYSASVFLDDARDLQGRVVEGLSVLNPKAPNLVDRLKSLGVTQVFLAIPSLPGARRREILGYLEALPFHVRSVPDLPQLVSGKIMINELREITVEDVLGREPVAPQVGLLRRCVAGKRVLVTGGG